MSKDRVTCIALLLVSLAVLAPFAYAAGFFAVFDPSISTCAPTLIVTLGVITLATIVMLAMAGVIIGGLGLGWDV